jgi:hypothetical protein
MRKIIILLLLICPCTLNGKSSFCKLCSIVKVYVDSCNKESFIDSTMQFQYVINDGFDPTKFYDEELPPTKKVVLVMDYLSKCRKLRKDIIKKPLDYYIALKENKCAYNFFSNLCVLSDDRILISVCTDYDCWHLVRCILLSKEGHKWKIQRVKETQVIS